MPYYTCNQVSPAFRADLFDQYPRRRLYIEDVTMSTVRIDARDVVSDIRQGMSDAALMEKYQVSGGALETLLEKLLSSGLIERQEITDRVQLTERTLTLKTHVCPACKLPQFYKFEVCPQCGIIVSKYRTEGHQGKKEVESKSPEISVDTFTLRPSPDGKTLSISGLNQDLQQRIIEAVKVVLLKSRE
jgi:uncharacterized Zn finger protein (UPF0148 family)